MATTREKGKKNAVMFDASVKQHYAVMHDMLKNLTRATLWV